MSLVSSVLVQLGRLAILVGSGNCGQIGFNGIVDLAKCRTNHGLAPRAVVNLLGQQRGSDSAA